MTTLLDKSNAIWDAIQDRMTLLIAEGKVLSPARDFVPRKKLRTGQQSGPALYAISRVTRVIDWGANSGIGELSVTFGVTNTTFRPEEVGAELENLINALVFNLMNEPTLGGADDMRVDEINPDDDPFGAEDTQPWATAALVWMFQFSRS